MASRPRSPRSSASNVPKARAISGGDGAGPSLKDRVVAAIDQALLEAIQRRFVNATTSINNDAGVGLAARQMREAMHYLREAHILIRADAEKEFGEGEGD